MAVSQMRPLAAIEVPMKTSFPFVVALMLLAFAAGLVSMLSFVLIAWLVGGYNAELGRVVRVDLVAIALLLCAGLISWLGEDRRP